MACLLLLALAACRLRPPASSSPAGTSQPTPAPSAVVVRVTPVPLPTIQPAAIVFPEPLPIWPTHTYTPSVSMATALPALVTAEAAGTNGQPTLADLWTGRASFVLQAQYTGLPMGESDTIVMSNGEFWSYLHSSSVHPAGAVDQCGDPVPFPGCTVIYRSQDEGHRFQHANPPVCQFACQQCPCTSEADHIEQQQYPDVYYDGQTLYLVYEYLGRVMLRRSTDGLLWSPPERVAETGIWKTWLLPCSPAERIGQHPFVPYDYECLAGGPPGVFVEDGQLYVFLAVGQSPGGMGCYTGPAGSAPATFRPCDHNPLFRGAATYGPTDSTGPAANRYFDFRTISSAELMPLDTEHGRRYYMLYEGLRGPGPGDHGDSQFGLGLARSLTSAIDGPWETYAGNPLLLDLPGNVGLGHADLVVHEGQTLLYTSLDGILRSRLVLEWHSTP